MTASPEISATPDFPQTSQDRALKSFTPEYRKQVKKNESKVTHVPENPAIVLFDGKI